MDYLCKDCDGKRGRHSERCRDCYLVWVRNLGTSHWTFKSDPVNKDAGRQRARRTYREVHPCVHCGNPGKERHHKDGNQLNNIPENVEWICRSCHMEQDGRKIASAERGRAMSLYPRQDCQVCGISFRPKGKTRRVCSRECRKKLGYHSEAAGDVASRLRRGA